MRDGLCGRARANVKRQFRARADTVDTGPFRVCLQEGRDAIKAGLGFRSLDILPLDDLPR